MTTGGEEHRRDAEDEKWFRPRLLEDEEEARGRQIQCGGDDAEPPRPRERHENGRELDGDQLRVA